MKEEVEAEGEGDERSRSLMESVIPSYEKVQAAIAKDKKTRLFGRQKPLHELLGGGHSADVLLWKNKKISGGLIGSATVVWVLFEWIGCHLVSLISLLLLGTMAALFVWSNVCAFLNRPPPPIYKVQISDGLMVDIARAIGRELNRVLSILYDISMGKDLKLFLKVVAGLWLLMILGGWFHFLTLLYIGVVAAHSFPVIYDKHEDIIDEYAEMALAWLHKLYLKLDVALLSKIPRNLKRKKDD